MNLEIRNMHVTPPNGWRYKVPETGTWIPDNSGDMVLSYENLVAKITKHYAANGMGMPVDIRQRIMAQMCPTLPPGYCYDGQKRLSVTASLRQSWSQIVEGTQVLADWWATSREYVEQTEADARAKICLACPYNGPPHGCPSCGGKLGTLRELILKIRGDRKTVLDDKLRSCYVCGCELRAKVWLPLDLLRRHITPEQLKQFPRENAFPNFAGCWLVKEP